MIRTENLPEPLSFKYIEAFEHYLESRDEHYVEGSIIVQEADIFKETDENKKIKKTDENKNNI